MNPFGDDGDSNDSDRLALKCRLLDAALEFAGQGLSVFPLTPGTKIPRRGSGGFHDATTDIDQIRDWWTADSQPNLGVRTVGLAVVDVDLYHPQCGASWDRFLELTRPESLPNTWVSRTGRGGSHHWYHLADPEDRYLKSGYTSSLPINGAIVRLPYIDLKSSGGSYVVAPPSVVPEGIYTWLRKVDLAHAPRWLRGPAHGIPVRAQRDRGVTIAGSAKRVEAICNIVATARQGERNNTLNWGAYRLAEVVAAGLIPTHLAHDALVESGVEAGLTVREATRTILSAFNAKRI